MEVVKERMTTIQFIESREGKEMAAAHKSEKSPVELMNYFDANYSVFYDDAPVALIIEDASDKLGEHDFVEMQKRNGFSDIMEMLKMEGFVTSIGSYFLVSTKFPLQGFLEE